MIVNYLIFLDFIERNRRKMAAAVHVNQLKGKKLIARASLNLLLTQLLTIVLSAVAAILAYNFFHS